MNVEFSKSGLAMRLRVSPSTISNWTMLATNPLRCEGLGRSARVRWTDYEHFAAKHPELRGVAKNQGPARTAGVDFKEIDVIRRALELAVSALEEATRTREAAEARSLAILGRLSATLDRVEAVSEPDQNI